MNAIRRRAVVFALAACPLLVLAQAAPVRKRLVLLGFREMFPGPNGLDEVARLLAERGWADGKQLEVLRVVIEPPREDAAVHGLDFLVPEIKRQVLPLNPDAIVALGSIMTKGAHLATRTIPIVAQVSDPVALGVAASLARPGGNVTGLSSGVAETSAKAMELFKALIPRLARVAILHDSRPVAVSLAAHYERAARGVGVEPVMVSSMEPAVLLRALRGLREKKRIQAALVMLPPGDEQTYLSEAAALRIPVLCTGSADAGCLVSYSASEGPAPPQLAPIVEQVLRGADPAGIPFQYPRTFRLVINKRVAAALGITVPPDLLLRADRVIE